LKDRGLIYTVDSYLNGILSKDKIILSKAITLIESNKYEDIVLANTLIERCIKLKKQSKRIAISGVPGVGKSTFINAFGKILLDELIKIGRKNNCPCIQLNVHRKNTAMYFYKKMGFELFEKVDIAYGAFWLNDYLLRKKI